MKTIELADLALSCIAPHPYNREFSQEGKEWDAFVEDVVARGIQERLVVRRMPGDGLQCLRGHRRRAAALEGGLDFAPCEIVSCDDKEAFEFMWDGNLHRVNPNPVDEARYVQGMVDLFGATVQEIAARLRHSVEWVRTRQMMLRLGDEVLEAVRRPGPDRLTMGAVEEILRVPEEFWQEAVQLVLLPDLELVPLTAEQASYELKKRLIEPKAREAAWEGLRPKLGKQWRKELERLCTKGTKEDLAIQVRTLKEAEECRVGFEDARNALPLADLLPGAPTPEPGGLLWLHLAVKHGLAVQVVPDGEGSKPVVNAALVRDAEAAAAEYGATGWMVTKRRKVEVTTMTKEEREHEERVARAKSVAEGEGDPLYQDSGEPLAETVIEQTMEHFAMIDMGAVRKVALWAVSPDADPMNAPDYVPKWACKLGVEGMWTEIDQITEWVLRLKK